jgi:hypothetical protein
MVAPRSLMRRFERLEAFERVRLLRIECQGRLKVGNGALGLAESLIGLSAPGQRVTGIGRDLEHRASKSSTALGNGPSFNSAQPRPKFGRTGSRGRGGCFSTISGVLLYSARAIFPVLAEAVRG